MTRDSGWFARQVDIRPTAYWAYSFLTVGFYPFVFRRVFTHYFLDLIVVDDYPPPPLRTYLNITPVAIAGYLISAWFVADVPSLLYVALICAMLPTLIHRVWAFHIAATLRQYYHTAYSISLKINSVCLFIFPVTTLLRAINTTLKDSPYA